VRLRVFGPADPDGWHADDLLRTAGIQRARVYDGSWSEWGADAGGAGAPGVHPESQRQAASARLPRTRTPVRFDAPVAERLASFAAANPGMSLSSAANRLVDEALRMSEHPGIMFRPGPTGRRAALAGGPDVWELVRAVKSARAAEPELADDGLLGLVADNTGTPLRLIRAAVRYWASYPGEVDAEISAADAAEHAAEQAWNREHQLLGR
jgi:hypothetical protein